MQAERTPSAPSLYIGAGSEYELHQRRRRLLPPARSTRSARSRSAQAATGAKAGGAKRARGGRGPERRRFVASGRRRTSSWWPVTTDSEFRLTDTRKSIGAGNATHHHHLICAARRGSPRGAVPRRRADAQQGPGPADHARPADARQRGQPAHDPGRNFKAQRRKNTLIFRAGNGRTAFAKPTPRHASASSWCACRPRWRAC